MKANQSALHYIKSPLSYLLFLSENIFYIFFVITEELSQHVRSDSAFASQNLKFAGDKCPMTGANLQACSGTQGPHIVKTRSMRPRVFFPVDLDRAKK